MFRTLSRGQLTFDIVAPGAIFVVLVIPYTLAVETLFVLIGMCAALTFWRLHTGLSLAIAWVTAVVEMSFALPPDPTNLAIFVVLYATAAYGTRRVKWLGFASVFIGAATIAGYLDILLRVQSPGVTTADTTRSALVTFFGFAVLFALSWTLGLLAKTFTTARDSRRAQTVAELEQDRARRDVMVEQERTRIARDMHDVVAHSLAVVIAQADGARYARHTDPDALDAALSTISGTARDALGDVRSLLGQLRHSQAAGPQPVLDDLGRLLEQLRAAGLSIRFAERGEAGALGTNQQIALYRIIQEALTNALRHGDTGADVAVSIDWFPDRVVARVVNATRAAESSEQRAGHGLSGMRERAALSGGRLEISTADGRFEVSASVPRLVAQSTTPESSIQSPATTQPGISPTGVPPTIPLESRS